MIKYFRYLWFLAFPALLGMGLLLYATALGPGVGGDATIYITCARNLIAGKGLGLLGPQGEFRLLPYFPPGFSLLLAGIGALGLDMVQAARWVNALFFGGLAWVCGDIILRTCGRRSLALLAGLLVALSPAMLPVTAWAMAEPAGIFLGFLSILLLIACLQEGEPLRLLVLSSVAAGLSFLMRYNSAAFVALGAFGILVYGRLPWSRKLRRLLAFSLIACSFMAVWVVVDVNLTDTLGSRRMLEAGEMAARAGNLLPAFSSAMLYWLVPDSWIYSPPYPGGIHEVLPAAVLAFLALWSGVILLTKKPDEEWASRVLALLAVFTAGFFALICGIYLTTYPPITINNRMLSPAHVAVICMAVLLVYLSLERLRTKPWARPLFTAALLLGVLWYGRSTCGVAFQLHRSGLGYTSLEWQSSETIRALNEIPPETYLVTNETNAVLFLTGRVAYPLMEVYRDHPLETFHAFGNGDLDDDTGQRLFREGKAALVLFDTIDGQMAELYGERTNERISALVLGLRRAVRGNDGGIFYYDGESSP